MSAFPLSVLRAGDDAACRLLGVRQLGHDPVHADGLGPQVVVADPDLRPRLFADLLDRDLVELVEAARVLARPDAHGRADVLGCDVVGRSVIEFVEFHGSPRNPVSAHVTMRFATLSVYGYCRWKLSSNCRTAATRRRYSTAARLSGRVGFLTIVTACIFRGQTWTLGR